MILNHIYIKKTKHFPQRTNVKIMACNNFFLDFYDIAFYSVFLLEVDYLSLFDIKTLAVFVILVRYKYWKINVSLNVIQKYE